MSIKTKSEVLLKGQAPGGKRNLRYESSHLGKIKKLIKNSITSIWGWVIDQSLLKTHEEMEVLRLASGFVPWQTYTITDFETKYLDPLNNSLFTWAVEQLNTRAISVNQLAEDAYSLSHPNDIISYELASQNIGIGFSVEEEGEGDTPNFTDLNNVSSFVFTTIWFDITLNTPLDYDWNREFFFLNDTEWYEWWFNDTITNLISSNKIDIVDNWGNSYSFEIKEDSDGWTWVPFNFQDVIDNVDIYFSNQNWGSILGTSKGRITRREDPIKWISLTLDWNTSIYDSADFRNGKLNRASLDPTSAWYATAAFYWSYKLTNLVGSVTWNRGTTTKTITVNSGDISALPIFGDYANSKDVEIKWGILAFNTTFGSKATSYTYEWLSQWVHIRWSATNVTIWKWFVHKWVFFGWLSDFDTSGQSALSADFFPCSFLKCTFDSWKLQWWLYKEWAIIQNLNLDKLTLTSPNFEETNITGQWFTLANWTVSSIRIKVTNPEWINWTEIDFNWWVLTDSFWDVTSGPMEGNFLKLWKNWETSTQWNVTGEMNGNDLAITRWIRTSTYLNWFKENKWFLRWMWNNNFDLLFQFNKFYWSIFESNASNSDYTNNNVFNIYTWNTHTQAATYVNFMSEFMDNDIDISLNRTNIRCEVSNQTLSVVNIDWSTTPEDLVWKSPLGKLWKESYDETWTPVITQVT